MKTLALPGVLHISKCVLFRVYLPCFGKNDFAAGRECYRQDL